MNGDSSPNQPNATSEILSLGKAIVEGAVHSEPLQDLGLDLGEMAVDRFLDEGFIRDLPILGTVAKAFKIRLSIRDALFLKKVGKFLVSCPTFTPGEREKFVREVVDNRHETQRLEGALVLLLDRLDDLTKPAMLAKVFAALVRGHINVEMFRRLAAAIDLGFEVDLACLANDPRQSQDVTSVCLPGLLRTGLVEFETGVRFQVGFKISLLGRVFIGCMNEAYDFACGV